MTVSRNYLNEKSTDKIFEKNEQKNTIYIKQNEDLLITGFRVWKSANKTWLN